MLLPYEWIKSNLKLKQRAKDVASALTMVGLEVALLSDTEGRSGILEASLTPNRSDCLSVLGLSREIAAIYDKPLELKPRSLPTGDGIMAKEVKITIKDDIKCPRYCSRIIKGVRVKPSPNYIQNRLTDSGIRPINNIVDATNYIMLELGQPVHAFDFSKIRGEEINVVSGLNEEMTLLDGTTCKVESDDLLINDRKGPIALAGIMGGANSGVSEETTTIILESGYFDSETIRATAKRLSIQTESSKRFEKGVDPNNTLYALNELTSLIIEIAGGKSTLDKVDHYPKKIEQTQIKLSVEKLNKLLGTTLSINDVVNLLNRLGLKGNLVESPNIRVNVPTYRYDIERPVDLIEEVARLNGYENIEESLPTINMKPLHRPVDEDLRILVRSALVSLGFSETMHYAFTETDQLKPYAALGAPIEIENPLGNESTSLRTSLVPALIESVDRNIRFGNLFGKLFELKTVFGVQRGKIVEEQKLGLMMFGTQNNFSWDGNSKNVDFYDVKGIVEILFRSMGLSEPEFIEDRSLSFLNPKESAQIKWNGENLGYIGSVHPDLLAGTEIENTIYCAELSWAPLLKGAGKLKKTFKKLSRYPSVRRDISMIVKEDLAYKDILQAVRDAAGKIVSDVKLFDLYKGKGIEKAKKSMAFAIFYSDKTKTLSDDEVNDAHERISRAVESSFGAEIR